jgi:two-component system, sensor histidine kinase
VVARLLQSLMGRGARTGSAYDGRRLDEALGLLGRRVLVVDDNLANQSLARAVLEAAGVEVVLAGDGVLALEAMAEQPFDVVLMDVRMPRMSGPEALARIRAGEAGRPDTAVIALTADAEDRRLVEKGFDGVLAKPARPADLLATVTKAAQAPRRSVRAA